MTDAYPTLTAEQLQAVEWWINSPEDTTVGEARARFAAVGLTPRTAQLAFYEVAGWSAVAEAGQRP